MFILKIILRWVGISCAVWVTSQIIAGVHVYPWYIAFVVGACIAIFNMFIKPIVSILTLPLNIITLGLFSLVINSAIFWYLGTIISGFSVDKFSTAFIGAILVSIISWIFKKIFPFD